MQNNIRFISDKELEKVNKQIRDRFGSNNQIWSGSWTRENGIKRVYFSLKNSNPQPSSMLEGIAKRVKETLGADEVYSMGARLL